MPNTTRQNLRTPGPTPIPDDIVEAMSDPMINHRGPEFGEMIHKTTEQLKQVFMTKNDLYILTASGTGSLEASIVNTLSPGDKVIAATAGAFGDRFVDMVEAYGADVKRMDFEWGGPMDPDAIRKALQADPDIKAVLARIEYLSIPRFGRKINPFRVDYVRTASALCQDCARPAQAREDFLLLRTNRPKIDVD